MQLLPAGVAHTLHRRAGRGHSEGDEEDEGREADEDELALGDMVEDGLPVEELVEPGVSAHVQRGVEEAVQAEHSAQADRPGPAEEGLERCAGERSDEEDERYKAKLVERLRDRVSTQLATEGSYEDSGNRGQRTHEHCWLEPRERRGVPGCPLHFRRISADPGSRIDPLPARRSR